MSYTTTTRPPTRAGWLVSLMLVTFVIGTDDFIIAGILPDIADDLAVSEAAAGQLVTVFSITYALAAPPLAVATARLPRKPMVVGGLSVFAAVNLVAAIAPSYAVLMALRVVAALIAAMVSPAVFGMAARLDAPGRDGRALGVVAAGLTVSLFIGVPLGSLLADTFGWRSTFVAVAGFSILVALSNARLLPRLPDAPEIGVRAQLRVLGRPAVLTSVLGTVMGASGGLLIYTYIVPITRSLSGQEGAWLAVFIAVVGVAGGVGTFVGGRLTDLWGADRTLVSAFASMAVAVVGLAVAGLSTDSAQVWLVISLSAFYGFAGWGFNPPMNARILRLAGEAGTEAVALSTSALYVGISIAGAVGGWSVASFDGTGTAVAAAVIFLVSLAATLMIVRRFPT
ncbi:MAG: MFS transporter [Candidatus Corynebacterium faecigallinarum]